MRIQKVSGGVTLWFGDNHPVNKSVSVCMHLNRNWLIPSKDNPFCSFRTNGAVKGKDSCLDVNVKLWCFGLSYTDWSLWRFKRCA